MDPSKASIVVPLDVLVVAVGAATVAFVFLVAALVVSRLQIRRLRRGHGECYPEW